MYQKKSVTDNDRKKEDLTTINTQHSLVAHFSRVAIVAQIPDHNDQSEYLLSTCPSANCSSVRHILGEHGILV